MRLPARDLIVIGASAGGLKALTEIVSGLPRDLRAAVLIVLHVSPYARSNLPDILADAGTLPVEFAADEGRILQGHVYIAPPDHHLLVRNGRMALSRSARENHQRPAVDVLFRTAAAAYGPRVAGVVLSGMLGDGSVGLMAVKAYGGVAIVQDPADAAYASMPLRAIEYAKVDHVLPAREIPRLLVQLAVRSELVEAVPQVSSFNDKDARVIQRDLDVQANGGRNGQVSVLSCPDCGGTLWQLDEGGLTQFHCHVGHTFAPEVLLVQKSEELETALWAAVRALVERATIARQVATRAREDGDAARAADFEAQAQQDAHNLELIRQEVLGAMPSAVSAVGGKSVSQK